MHMLTEFKLYVFDRSGIVDFSQIERTVNPEANTQDSFVMMYGRNAAMCYRVFLSWPENREELFVMATGWEHARVELADPYGVDLTSFKRPISWFVGSPTDMETGFMRAQRTTYENQIFTYQLTMRRVL